MKTVARILTFLLATVFLWSAHAQTDSLYYGTLDEVTVKPKENPAHRIINAAIARRDSNSAFHCSSFKYVTYHKMTVLPTKVSDSLARLKDQNLFISESVSEVYFKQPNNKYEKLVASKISGLDKPIFNMVFSRIQFQNFYENDYLEIFQVKYVSPISKGATKRYAFQIEDTLLNGSDTTFVISYQPRPNVTFKSLKGVLHIHADDFAIERIEAEPVDKNVLLHVPVTQEYQKIENGTWFPSQLTATFKLPRLAFKGDTLESRGISTITVKEIEIGLPLRNRDFGIFDVEEQVESKKSSDALLTTYRNDTLTKKELRTYELLDSISNKMKLNKRLELLPALLQGYVPIGPIDLDIASIVNYTYYEGWRFGLGLYTNRRLTNRGRFGGYFAYGLKDKDWKWGAMTEWELYRKRSLLLRLRIFDDIVESGCTQIIGRDEIGLLNGEYYRHWIITKFDKSRTLSGKLQMRADKNFTVSVSAAYSQNRTLFNYGFAPSGGDGGAEFRYTNAYVRAGLRFSYQETTYKTNNFTLYEGSKYPTFQLQYERGIKGVFGSDFNYNKVNVRVHHWQRYKRLGYSEIAVTGGFVDRSLPYSLLFVMPAGYEKIGFYGKEQFAAMRPNEFVGDSYVAIFLRHNFGKMWEGKFSPRIVLCQNIGFCWMRHPNDHLGITAHAMEKGYFETGLMIDNLISARDLLAMGIGFFYRYGAYGLEKVKDNFAIKVSLTVPMYE
ncbi:MAG: hypothetical protein IJT61_06160 [Bacteroidales bacterium]|nr:hypothetical protein [Bacteroidales bacterium]